ncbi:hypothetical protein H0E87_008630 [Populus deltoides]|uniref:Protein kinase domain-containing protein n=1 Tax=Populus deltoides TaxID=3696 RepID=A0A8T2Z1K0_POPDE|nr:hypothetical protein H0E87_008630 [Populus deltoides]
MEDQPHFSLAPRPPSLPSKHHTKKFHEFQPENCFAQQSKGKYLFDQPTVALNWSQRFRVIKGVALGLFYLHKEWEQVVIHRDVKASNVLLDGELNGRLGDFGLARLYENGSSNDPYYQKLLGILHLSMHELDKY